MDSIGFWIKQSGNLFSAKRGLTPEQIAFLQELKPGDRLVIWKNNEEDAPTYTLKKYNLGG